MIIAEIGINHQGDMGTAKQLIRLAKEHGADAVKFQLYAPKALFEPGPLLEEALHCELSHDEWLMLVEYSKSLDMPISASAFDAEHLEWVHEIDPPFFKIASRTALDWGFSKLVLNEAERLKKPTYISLGMIAGALGNLKDYQKYPNARFLHCKSQYPAYIDKWVIGDWQDIADATHGFGVAFKPAERGYIYPNKIVGISDHTVGIEMALWAIAHGARVIEKHFTLDKTQKGSDHACSMDPLDLKLLSSLAPGIEALAEKALG